MKFVIAFVATLACAFASPTYVQHYAAPAHHAGAYAHHPPADIKVLSSGFLADTPEVSHAKAAHHVEKAKVASKSAYYTPAPYVHTAPVVHAAPYYSGSYTHSVADIKVLPSGYLADTPEVAHAKAVHSADKAKASAAAAANPDDESYSYAAPTYAYAAPTYAHAAPAYTHSVADIKVLPSGFLADTPEVAHAKAVHSSDKAKASAAAAANPDHESYSYAAPAYAYTAYPKYHY